MTDKSKTSVSNDKKGARLRMLISGVIAFVFYFGWAYWANLAPTIPIDVTLRTAFVQGSYSGLVTLFFTLGLELSIRQFDRNRLSGMLIAPLIPLVIQSIFVILVNVINKTPNLWLTVTPSIVFSGLYGYVYAFVFLKKESPQPKG